MSESGEAELELDEPEPEPDDEPAEDEPEPAEDGSDGEQAEGESEPPPEPFDEFHHIVSDTINKIALEAGLGGLISNVRLAAAGNLELPDSEGELEKIIGDVLSKRIASLVSLQNPRGAHQHVAPVIVEEEGDFEQSGRIHVHHHHHFMNIDAPREGFDVSPSLRQVLNLGPNKNDRSYSRGSTEEHDPGQEEGQQQQRQLQGDEYTANQLFFGGTILCTVVYMYCMLTKDLQP